MLSFLGRLRAVFLLGFLAVSVAACGDRVELLSAISEQEANEVLSALLSVGIQSQKVPGKDGLVSITVDGSQVAHALAVMRASGLPRQQFARMGDVFRKEGLISSPLEERARYVYALSQGLAETISQIDGVITARVHVVLPDRAPGTGEQQAPSSAAVFIKYKEVYDLDSVVPQIKRLVTNSIAGLNYDNVSVILVPSMESALLAPISEIGGDGQGNPMILAAMAALGVLALAGFGAAGGMYWMWRIRPNRQGADAARS
ncbi:type III secretion system inner membrane ring lipoprotein SctJ [Telmatospirillum sp. J64-1]|uniref:type III secretion system inner membrane ring lipoprotein SctJ n=1 Tax=Telmatospirillum sp. J64-1 TaxID=2502183 RepID=UPI00115D1D86|nr:type III secretion inner membrane ring lipoprotein SctJ [Telmatospirillum sp. J64-1]